MLKLGSPSLGVSSLGLAYLDKGSAVYPKPNAPPLAAWKPPVSFPRGFVNTDEGVLQIGGVPPQK